MRIIKKIIFIIIISFLFCVNVYADEFTPHIKIKINYDSNKREDISTINFNFFEDLVMEYIKQFANENVPNEYRIQKDDMWIAGHQDFINQGAWKYGDDIYTMINIIVCPVSKDSKWISEYDLMKMEGENLINPDSYMSKEMYWKFVYDKEIDTYDLVYISNIPIGYEEIKNDLMEKQDIDIENYDFESLLSEESKTTNEEKIETDTNQNVEDDTLAKCIRIGSAFMLVLLLIFVIMRIKENKKRT